MIAPPRSFALRPHGIARFEDGAVVLLDQTQLPAAVVEVRLVTWQEVAEAIRGLVVRGAPAIGIAAAYGIVLAASRSRAGSVELLREDVERACSGLVATRPTAVNLAWAVERMRERVAEPYA
ncbi:MAG TPA: hypothetical protein VIM27_02325, partial [Gaiellales bacterium]